MRFTRAVLPFFFAKKQPQVNKDAAFGFKSAALRRNSEV
jgi:hypothetical protein